MSNLLPESSLKKLLREFRARFILIASLLSIATAIVSALALAPAFITLYTTQPDVPPTTKQSDTDLIDIATAQLLMQNYSPLLRATSTTNAVRAALAAKPKDARVDHMTYSRGTPSTLVVSGLAANRDSINAYHEALLKGAYFTSVVVPVGDLVGAQGGRFKVTLSGDF